MTENIRILSTKKLLANQKQFLLNANFSVVEADFIETKVLPIKIDSKINDALIFSSQNAVNSVLEFEKINSLKEKKSFVLVLKQKLY